MLKTISAALLAVSVLAAPALAAGQATKQATKQATNQATTRTAQAPVIKAEQVKQTKPSALNANARMGRHHVRHASHHRFHKHYGALKSHKFSKVSTKHMTPAIKRG
jgi:hypothetical protein